MEVKIWGCAGAHSLIAFVAHKRLKCQVFMSKFPGTYSHSDKAYKCNQRLPCLFDRFYEGGYLHLKSSIMRTHGAKEQRDTIIDYPSEKLATIVEVFFYFQILVSSTTFASTWRYWSLF